MSERCMRCGSVGEDRRTLHMACFYDLDELGIPFEKEILFHADLEDCTLASKPVGIDLPDGKRINLQAGTVRCSGELTPQNLYTLRVCKRCRGEWMQSLQDWFRAPPEGMDHDADNRVPDPDSPGTGIYLREHGAIREVSLEEWEARKREMES